MPPVSYTHLDVYKRQALFKEIEGKIYEPMERLHIDVPEEYYHFVAEKMGKRKGQLLNIVPSGKRMKACLLYTSFRCRRRRLHYGWRFEQ